MWVYKSRIAGVKAPLNFLPIQSSLFLPYSLPLHVIFCPPPLCPHIYCLSYQTVQLWLLFFNKWRWSWPRERMEAMWIQKGLFISSSRYFIQSRSRFHSFTLSLYLRPSILACSLSISQEIALKAWCIHWMASPVAVLANTIITLVPDCGASLTHLHLPVLLTVQPLSNCTELALTPQIQASGCRKEGLWDECP